MKHLPFISAALLSLAAFALPSSTAAAPITFTHSGIGAGSLGGNAFGDSAFTITAIGNTDNRESFASGYFIVHDSASITIAGLGTFAFTTGTRTFFNDVNNTPGFSRSPSGSDLFNGPYSLLTTWDMLTSVGPIVGTTQLMQWTLSPAVLTTGGQLIFTGEYTTGSFAAVVGPVSAPDSASTLFLLGGALAALCGWRRRLAA